MVIFFKQSCRLVSFRYYFQIDNNIEEVPNRIHFLSKRIIRSISFSLVIYLILLHTISFAQPVNWIKMTSRPCDDLEVINDSTFIGCILDEVQYTSDGGKSWIQKSPRLNSNGYYVTRNELTNSIFIFSRYNYKLLKSTDNGENWFEVLSVGSFIPSIISKKGTIYLINNKGVFFRSTDDGISWDSSYVGPYLRSLDVCMSGQIFIGTYFDKIYTSKDSGKSWIHLTNYQIDNLVNSIAINNKDEIFVTHANGIIVSNDYGLTWTLHTTPISLRDLGILVFDDQNNLYGGYRSIIKSTNGGLEWTNLGGDLNLEGIYPFGDIVYLAAAEGIFKYDPLIPIYIGNNYFPLHLGNIWQYLSYSSSMRDPNNYELVEDRIIRDTLINNYKYYSYRSNWVRYSEVDKKIFIRAADTDQIYMDFNLPAMATFPHYDLSTIEQATVLEGEEYLFENNVKFKGYKVGNLMNGKRSESFGENVGLIEYSFDVNIGPDYSAGKDLMMAVIYDSTNTPRYLSNHYKPEINLTPINFISTSEFQINFKVNHKYSRIYDPINPFKTVNFIDSVYMVSNYSKGDSVINKNTLFALNTEKTKKYLISSIIDTTLLKDGFTFNYKIIAKDKGIIPETSSSPDTGYYQIKWGTTSVDDIKNEVIGFNLEQNYPNPFNPSTVISWQLPIGSFVTLKVYDMLGNEIATLVNEEKQPGEYHNEFVVKNYELASGIYFYQLRAGNLIETKKMIILR